MSKKPDGDFRDDLGSIIRRRKPEKARLPKATPKPPIGSVVGRGQGTTTVASEALGGGGIDSPLTEVDDSRMYHSNYAIVSPDGLTVMILKPIKQTKFKDASGREITVNYTDPAP